jgi:hypothetical protein
MQSKLLMTIKELAEDPAVQRTMVGRIRELLPVIEQAQRSGVGLAKIAEVLREQEFSRLDLKCLQNLLYQARKRRFQKSPSDKPRHSVETKPSLGIDAETIVDAARSSIKARQTSILTLSLLQNKHQPKKGI